MIKKYLLATDMALWRKRGLFIMFIVMGLFLLYMTYSSASGSMDKLWELRYFVVIGLTQVVAQVALGWYILKNTVPYYLIVGVLTMAMFNLVMYSLFMIFNSGSL